MSSAQPASERKLVTLRHFMNIGARPDHAQPPARMALNMRGYIRSRPPRNGKRLDFRIGINSGPLVAGVIGTKKFVYDLSRV